jgi:glycine cleavage system regulatory protein
MARLAGQFAGIVLVDAPRSLLADLRAMEGKGLRIVVQSGLDEPAAVVPPQQPRLALEVVGNDRPGIMRDITQILARHSVNIEELTTGVVSQSFTGGTLFRATAMLRPPDAEAVEAVRADLEGLGNELIVDIQTAAESASAF